MPTESVSSRETNEIASRNASPRAVATENVAKGTTKRTVGTTTAATEAPNRLGTRRIPVAIDDLKTIDTPRWRWVTKFATPPVSAAPTSAVITEKISAATTNVTTSVVPPSATAVGKKLRLKS